jgi:hypothetical protein
MYYEFFWAGEDSLALAPLQALPLRWTFARSRLPASLTAGLLPVVWLPLD